MLERADGDSKEVFSLFIGSQRGGEIKKENWGEERGEEEEGEGQRWFILKRGLCWCKHPCFFFPLFFFLPGFSCTLVCVNTVEITTCALTDLHVLQIS